MKTEGPSSLGFNVRDMLMTWVRTHQRKQVWICPDLQINEHLLSLLLFWSSHNDFIGRDLIPPFQGVFVFQNKHPIEIFTINVAFKPRSLSYSLLGDVRLRRPSEAERREEDKRESQSGLCFLYQYLSHRGLSAKCKTDFFWQVVFTKCLKNTALFWTISNILFFSAKMINTSIQ